MGILIDFGKAFDNINHKQLIIKPYLYGSCGELAQLISSCLQYHNHLVKHSSYSSPLQNLKNGVPQGCILGPLLFIWYIYDIFQLNAIAFWPKNKILVCKSSIWQ